MSMNNFITKENADPIVERTTLANVDNRMMTSSQTTSEKLVKLLRKSSLSYFGKARLYHKEYLTQCMHGSIYNP
ncbi:hypothetical protein Tcan_18779 [Toxocara canis]|uniref:Uncharacterized protein n=1 Tax=Toxocara canis TaxID=6265 RepID=A0A0B2VQ89_TOXCA|nr:hypothetical protein Tcan_18779 [Toxocara canis]